MGAQLADGWDTVLFILHGSVKGWIAAVSSRDRDRYCYSLPSRHYIQVYHAGMRFFLGLSILHRVQVDWVSGNSGWFPNVAQVPILPGITLNRVLLCHHRHNWWGRNWQSAWPMCYHLLHHLADHDCQYDILFS